MTKRKDLNAPKKPLSSYIIFCQEQREVLKKKNPDMKATELTSKLGDMWNNLSSDKKKVYAAKAEKDKERYQEEMSNYTPPKKDEDEVDEKEEKTKRKRKEKDPNVPKRTPSGYILFCQDMRSEVKGENPNMTPTQITSKLGELWRELSDSEKAKYMAKSKNASSSSSSSTSEKSSKQSNKKEVEEKPKSRQEKVKRKRKSEEEDLDDE